MLLQGIIYFVRNKKLSFNEFGSKMNPDQFADWPGPAFGS